MKLDVNDIKQYSGTTKKGKEVLSKLEIDKEYTFKELGCAVQTWDSLIINRCIDHFGAAMLPSHKVGTFRVSKRLLHRIEYGNGVKNGTILPPGPITIKLNKLHQL